MRISKVLITSAVVIGNVVAADECGELCDLYPACHDSTLPGSEQHSYCNNNICHRFYWFDYDNQSLGVFVHAVSGDETGKTPVSCADARKIVTEQTIGTHGAMYTTIVPSFDESISETEVRTDSVTTVVSEKTALAEATIGTIPQIQGTSRSPDDVIEMATVTPSDETSTVSASGDAEEVDEDDDDEEGDDDEDGEERMEAEETGDVLAGSKQRKMYWTVAGIMGLLASLYGYARYNEYV